MPGYKSKLTSTTPFKAYLHWIRTYWEWRQQDYNERHKHWWRWWCV